MTEHEKLVEIIVSTDLSKSSGRLMDAYNIADNLIANGVAVKTRAKWKLLNEGRGTCTNCNFTQACVWDYDHHQQYCGVCGAKMSLED